MSNVQVCVSNVQFAAPDTAAHKLKGKRAMPASIETYAPPAYLYRFRNVGAKATMSNKSLRYEIDAIRRGQVWCGEYHKLNDAMEGLYEAGEQTRQNERWEEARGLIRNRKASVGIACFSELWNQALMWAHYADSFRGLCIKYDFRVLRETLPSRCSFSRISYADRLLDIGADLEDSRHLAKWILSTKHHSWAYEREWRLFNPSHGILEFNPRAVREVILGPRMPETVKRFLRNYIDGELIRESRISGYEVEVA
ncbi:DUF2971 domain-containing protein [Rhizobium laguerreae]|uniref:DUF2971 domain-containing protein n=1 Tax=Rhizobium laguerreae TaxID=1076926 RepID=UPI001C914193|nr:DUF2971 domain-containing protein [Rhizobium laguerreae]MBY3315079.1 DUF2971 domain-containing protein [Rhizobium laguerreae]